MTEKMKGQKISVRYLISIVVIKLFLKIDNL